MSARSLNRATIIGNLTRDPDMRHTPNGAAVCTFGVATNRSWTPSDGGETQEEVEYHRVVAWGKLAEICDQLLFKGRKVFCEGRLQTRKWTGQDGAERQTTEIVIDSMIALSPPQGSNYPDDSYSDDPGPSDSGSSSSSSQSDADDQPKAKKTSSKKEEVDIDDIPF